MADQIRGHCLCGASRYSASGPAKFAIVCYCTDCQRVTGAGHAPQLGVPSDGFTMTGPVKEREAIAESGNTLTFKFCSECGSPVAKTTGKAPTTIFLYAGSLDDPADFPPDAIHVFEDSRAPWDT